MNKRKSKCQLDFKYSPVQIVIAKIMSDGTYRYTGGVHYAYKEVFCEVTLDQGEYIIFTQIN